MVEPGSTKPMRHGLPACANWGMVSFFVPQNLALLRHDMSHNDGRPLG